MTNLNLAFDIAEKHLDIPKMLDAEGKSWSFSDLFCVHELTFDLPCRSRRGRQAR